MCRNLGDIPCKITRLLETAFARMWFSRILRAISWPGASEYDVRKMVWKAAGDVWIRVTPLFHTVCTYVPYVLARDFQRCPRKNDRWIFQRIPSSSERRPWRWHREWDTTDEAISDETVGAKYPRFLQLKLSKPWILNLVRNTRRANNVHVKLKNVGWIN